MANLVGSLACIDDMFLVREAQSGNRQAFEELVRHYDRAILPLAFRITGSERDAQDIYQDTFLRAYSKLRGFRFESCFSTWIYRIVTNLCMEHLRKKHRHKESSLVAVNPDGKDYALLDSVSADPSCSETALMQRDLGIRLNCAFERLTPFERLVFELKHFQGLKLRAIGQVLGVTEQAVKTSFFRATRELRAGLANLR
jgi:RNA polymerase sigma-70 factor (ECF subfamily)